MLGRSILLVREGAMLLRGMVASTLRVSRLMGIKSVLVTGLLLTGEPGH